MTWLMLAVGFFLLLSGILSQAYSLKTKRGRSATEDPHLAGHDPAAALSRRSPADGHGRRPDRSPPRARSTLARLLKYSVLHQARL